jgi:serine/threonine-protein kinase
VLGSAGALELVGTGATTSVYRAVDARGERVALKARRLSAPFDEGALLTSFERERDALAEIGPRRGVVRLVDAGIEDDPRAALLVLSWIEGAPLGHEPAPSGAASARAHVIRDHLARALDALEPVHDAGWVHADLKPSNLLVGRAGEVTLIDFGAAVRGGNPSESLSPAYAAPEQVRGEPLDPRSDLFALGCVAYRLATGAPPTTGSAEVVRGLRASEPAHRLPASFGAWGRWVTRLLDPRREARPRSVQEARAALHAL